jgi:PIN domain nuclease of toxin-antitoxin system
VTVVDTHVLVWMDADDRRLGARARRAIDRALAAQELAVSAISYWEIAMLQAKGRVKIRPALSTWRQDQLRAGLIELAVDGAIGIEAAGLVAFHGDPADRLIVAAARAHGATLITADERILSWKAALKTLDASA